MRLLIFPILIFLTYEVFANKSFCIQEGDYGLYTHDSVCYWIGAHKLGVGDGETITYNSSYTVRLPKNVISWISGGIELFKLSDEQYIYIESPEYSIHNSMHKINDTIYVPDSMSIISFISKYDGIIHPPEYTLEDWKKLKEQDSTIYQSDSIFVRNYSYLKNIIAIYDSLDNIALDETRESRFMLKDGYTILFFNFIPSEIDKTLSLIEITTHEDNENIKSWKSRKIKTVR